MTEGDKPLAALKAMLLGDGESYKQAISSLSHAEGEDFLVLLSAAFLEMSDRTFGPEPTPAAVVEWVGEIRSRSETSAQVIDPAVAEKVILFALGLDGGNELSGNQVSDTQLLLLPILAHEQHLDGAAIDELLSAARELTRQ